METKQLKDGSMAPLSVVLTTVTAMDVLYQTNPIALHELVQLARNPEHKPFGLTGAALSDLGLTTSEGELHDITRHVVLSAAVGDGMDLRLVSPVQE